MKAICLPRRNRPSFRAFCSTRLTFFLKCEFWMILCNAEAIFASNISKFGKFFPTSDIARIFISSNESTFSTSLIHNVASERKSEQELTWVLNLIFLHEKWCGEFIELKLRYLQYLLYSHGIVEFPLVRRNSWLTAFLQSSALVLCYQFVLHISRQVALHLSALGLHLWQLDS